MEYADGGDLACKIRDRKEKEKLFEVAHTPLNIEGQ